jgi:hypothetical protein
MMRLLATIILGLVAVVEAGAEPQICIAHTPGQLPSGSKTAVGSIDDNSHPPPGSSNVHKTLCINSDIESTFSYVLCEAGQDGPNGTFDGPYSCTNPNCSAASGYQLTELFITKMTAKEMHPSTGGTYWQVCVEWGNQQTSNRRHLAIYGVQVRSRAWWQKIKHFRGSPHTN